MESTAGNCGEPDGRRPPRSRQRRLWFLVVPVPDPPSIHCRGVEGGAERDRPREAVRHSPHRRRGTTEWRAFVNRIDVDSSLEPEPHDRRVGMKRLLGLFVLTIPLVTVLLAHGDDKAPPGKAPADNLKVE